MTVAGVDAMGDSYAVHMLRRDTAVLGVLGPPKRAVADIFTAIDVSVQGLGKKHWLTAKKLAF